MMTQGPLIPQKTWPSVITWQNQHTHLVVSAAAAPYTGIGGDVEFCNWLGGIYADGTLTVWFPA